MLPNKLVIKFSDKAQMLRQLPIILLVPFLVLPGLIPGDLPFIFPGTSYQAFSEGDVDEDGPCLEAFQGDIFTAAPFYSLFINTFVVRLKDWLPENRHLSRAPPYSI
jgi:hypothetical protein